GRLEHDDMVRVFGSSRINLNLSNAFPPDLRPRTRLRRLARGEKTPPARRSQIKGRTFEVPGSGGVLLTDDVPHLERYLEPDRDVGVFDSTDDLVEKVDWWLRHPEERAAVADAGYRRVLAEHTYDHRFAQIFEAAGLN